MIYVVELNQSPVKLASGNIAAYGSREKADRAAKTFGAKVTMYAFGGTTCLVDDGEGLTRQLDDLNEECAQLKRDMQAERDGNALLRRKHGAHDEETMGMFMARLAHSHREWGKIMEALRNFHRGPCRDTMPSCDTCSGLGYVVLDDGAANDCDEP